MENFSLPKWGARNPLGIVALFISLIYGMSAILLGTSIKDLSSNNQTILVVFVVTFPFVVLAVFAWLVSRHHMKLYGPSDYRSDKGFLDVFGTLNPSEVGKRLEQQTEELEKQSGGAEAAPTSEKEKAIPSSTISSWARSWRPAEVFLVENLALQALQKEFGAAIKRNAKLGSVGVDGVIEKPGVRPTIVEIKLVRSYAKNLADVVYSARRQIDSIRSSLESEKILIEPKFLVVFVAEDVASISRLRELVARDSRLGEDTAVKYLLLSDLLSEFGFSGPPG